MVIDRKVNVGWLIATVVGFVFNAGVTYAGLQTIKEAVTNIRIDQKASERADAAYRAAKDVKDAQQDSELDEQDRRIDNLEKLRSIRSH
jgi:hypothetical protein